MIGLTGGQGVDVVLNSLAGEAINRNLRVLRPFGRFLELGKRTLGIERAFNKAVGYTAAHDRLPDFFRTEKLPPHNITFAVPDEELDQVFAGIG